MRNNLRRARWRIAGTVVRKNWERRIAVLLCMIGCTYQLWFSVLAYLERPTMLDIEIRHPERVLAPAITVCNLNGEVFPFEGKYPYIYADEGQQPETPFRSESCYCFFNYSVIYKRSWFLEERQNVHDDERSGRPVTATGNAAVAAARNVVEADRRVTIDEIMIRLPPGIEIRLSSIGTIMPDVLNFRKVCARWVPRLLSENHKQQQMEAVRAFLEMHRRDVDQLFSRIVTGDESWVHHSTPETKRQSMVWKKPEESAPKKAKVTISAGKVMAIVSWDCKGILLVDYLPPNTTVNAERYCEVLTKLRAAIKRKRPGHLSRKALLVHDNARPHAARTTQTLLENFKWEIFTHSPYSPDLAPSDFYLFPALKLHLGGKNFANDDEVQTEANHWLRRQDTAWYNSGIKKLLQRSSFNAVFISSSVAKRRPFMGLFSLGNKRKSQGGRSGEYGGCGFISVLFLAKKVAHKQQCVSRGVIVVQKPIFVLPQIRAFLADCFAQIAHNLQCSGVRHALRRSHLLGLLRTFCTTDKRCFGPRRDRLIRTISNGLFQLGRNCFTFNSLMNGEESPSTYIPTASSDVGNYIRIVLDAEPHEYFTAFRDVEMVVAVHSPYLLVNAERMGRVMTPGHSYSVFLKPEVSNLLPAPFAANCTDYQELWMKNGKSGPLSEQDDYFQDPGYKYANVVYTYVQRNFNQMTFLKIGPLKKLVSPRPVNCLKVAGGDPGRDR
ncbi:hypothetical protein LAZ67_4003248 [Cordylochernes scorpioides]|uniref:Mariner Mos1 transposase n=1 Tax=Cordylochernes scorpioides TaxID=51811 RepID=A0ABY6KEF9_9ARAC|nr:hypothetical protein LAZ67_4003248 [Cordylochernes scorpioides]